MPGPVPESASPAAAHSPQLRPLPQRIAFALENSDLDKTARATLRALAAELRAAADVSALRVLAYTDPTGSDAYNLAISARRAAHVCRFLAEQGVGNVHLVPHPRGAVEFRGDNATRPGRVANRRVEFVAELRAPTDAP